MRSLVFHFFIYLFHVQKAKYEHQIAELKQKCHDEQEEVRKYSLYSTTLIIQSHLAAMPTNMGILDM